MVSFVAVLYRGEDDVVAVFVINANFVSGGFTGGRWTGSVTV